MKRAGQVIADIVLGLVSIFKGMWVTLVNWSQRKITGGDFVLRWNAESERLKCVACLTCQRTCPTGVITITGTGKGKSARPIRFEMDLTKCMACHLCVEACPFDAIDMQPTLVPNSRTRLISRGLHQLAERPPANQTEAWEFQVSGQPDPPSQQHGEAPATASADKSQAEPGKPAAEAGT